MCSSGLVAFRKQLTCPPAETLLAYGTGSLAGARREQVAAHLAECEFCGAELQLLDRCPPGRERSRVAAIIPPHLKNMFEELVVADLRAAGIAPHSTKKGRA